MTPNRACNTPSNVIFQNLYGVKSLSTIITKPSLKHGQTVRVAYDKGVFDKGYLRTFSDSTGTIESVTNQVVPMYRLKDYAGNFIKRNFYVKELQAIPEPKYRIEKIIKTRKNREGVTEYYVKWLGYPSSANSWVTSIEDV
jgi:hypothetical protein